MTALASVVELKERAREIVLAAEREAAPAAMPGAEQLARYFDHTLLKAEATREQIARLCAEGRALGVAAVCVNGAWVGMCAEALRGSAVRVAAVAGFPLGAMATPAKAAETRQLVADGATEIDMVIALGHAKAGEWAYVREDVAAVVEAAGGATVKAILETAALMPEEIAIASLVAVEAGAHFVKTSTGFHPAGGATVEAVRIMRRAVGSGVGVKASGGIRDGVVARTMLMAGANRLGTSSTAAILHAFKIENETKAVVNLIQE